MTVAELMTLLKDYYPDENVTVYNISSHRNMQILGVDTLKTSEYGTLTLSIDWAVKDAVVETKKDQLERQKEIIEADLAKIKKEESRQKASASMKKRHAYNKKKREANAAKRAAKAQESSPAVEESVISEPVEEGSLF